jgi:DNA primase
MAKHESHPKGGTGSSSLFGVAAGLGGERLPAEHGGIDFRALREAAPMAEVLDLLGWRPVARNGPQLRGPCPIHKSSNEMSRSFSVNLDTGAFQCFSCGGKGNQLDLWAAVVKLPIYEAAISLAEHLGVELTRIRERRDCG